MFKGMLLGGFLFSVVSFSASAELTLLESGDILDTETGLEWRSFKGTINLSLADVEQQIESGSLAGYRIAYYDEVTAMLNSQLSTPPPWNGGESAFSFAVNGSELSNYYNLFGVTNPSWEASYGLGYIDETNSSAFSTGIDYNSGPDLVYQTNPQTTSFKSSSRGVFLINEASLSGGSNVSDVSVPFLSAVCLLSLCFGLRRKVQGKRKTRL